MISRASLCSRIAGGELRLWVLEEVTGSDPSADPVSLETAILVLVDDWLTQTVGMSKDRSARAVYWFGPYIEKILESYALDGDDGPTFLLSVLDDRYVSMPYPGDGSTLRMGCYDLTKEEKERADPPGNVLTAASCNLNVLARRLTHGDG